MFLLLISQYCKTWQIFLWNILVKKIYKKGKKKEKKILKPEKKKKKNYENHYSEKLLSYYEKNPKFFK